MKTLAMESERLTDMIGKSISRSPINGSRVFVFDDVLKNPLDYARNARASHFHSVAVGPATFHGIADADQQILHRWLVAKFPRVIPTLSFFRESPAEQDEPNFVHTDRDMGDWTAILYLTEKPADGDGTTFWRDDKTGEYTSRETNIHAEGERWADLDRWREGAAVDAVFNRCLVFSSALFHSRALFENYGTAGKDARLIQVVFGTGLLEQS